MKMICNNPRAAAVATVLAIAGTSFGQDSVPSAAGGNDALSAYDLPVQQRRYVVDLQTITTSWGNELLVGPIIKASRDIDPSFKTQILGASAVSPSLSLNTAFASRGFSRWTAAGQGVNPSFNTAPAMSESVTGFATQFGVVASDFSLNPTNILGAIIGRSSSSLSRLYVERTVAAVSRVSTVGVDTSTLSLGAVDALGNAFIRADNFNTLPTTTNRVLGDNVARIALASRNTAARNQFTSVSGNNTATDAPATAFIVSNEATPTNVPSGVLQPGVGAFGLVFDFTNRLRVGSTTANLSNLGAAHLAPGITGHRGNPSFSPLLPLGGNAGTVATLGFASAGGKVNALDAVGLNFGNAGAPPVIGASPRGMTLPSPISSPDGFSANASGDATFRQYLSQVPFRGGNGLVGVGQNTGGNLVLAATANDPTQGDFIAVATSISAGVTNWTVAAHQNQPVLDGPNGAAIGALDTPSTTISAPAVDRLGNVYFVATWKPNLAPVATGLFKAVTTPSGFKLELLLTTGQAISGVNSLRTYTITSLALSDSDSMASGAFHHQQLIQEQAPTALTGDPMNIRAFGGAIVNTVITYNNGGINENYEAVLFLGPTEGELCPADFNASGAVSVQDIFDFLSAYFLNSPSADFNHSGGVSVQDIFDFLSAYFTPCV
ncbi:MAG: hypothetical protein IT438_12505 [Phycisphaerales bacterium]|nr:hypothetical protein [Phycisphaerales bacterium]